MAVDHSTRYRLNRNWLHQFRRLGVRWERPELHEAGMHLACAFICHSELRSTRLLPGDCPWPRRAVGPTTPNVSTFAFHAGGKRAARMLALGGPLAIRGFVGHLAREATIGFEALARARGQTRRAASRTSASCRV